MPRSRKTQDDACAPIAIAILTGIFLLVLLLDWAFTTPVGRTLSVLTLVGGGVLVVQRTKAWQIRHAEQARILEAQSREIALYHGMNPRQFEDAIAYLCHRDGYTDTRRTGVADDLGADVTAIAPDGRRIVIQCKRCGPTTTVGSAGLQRFGGTCHVVHGAHVAAVVTTSRFTRPAAEYARATGIHLFDQHALAAWASRTGPTPWML
ncbi:restriction endonuclease [Streptomyces sp. NPDC005820]|uniref:restriction endonuclease n=1 Tax=Streptomyces sp. NPDC005820 TaxID=3157069 RepID=UPI0033CE2835